jgi:hypothetical protein
MKTLTLNNLIENLILAREGKLELNFDFRKAEEDVRWILIREGIETLYVDGHEVPTKYASLEAMKKAGAYDIVMKYKSELINYISNHKRRVYDDEMLKNDINTLVCLEKI